MCPVYKFKSYEQNSQKCTTLFAHKILSHQKQIWTCKKVIYLYIVYAKVCTKKGVFIIYALWLSVFTPE